MKNLLGVLYFILISVLLFNCKKDNNEPQSSYLLFPAGRSFLSNSEVKVSINNSAYVPENMYDSCGGYWLKIPKVDLPASGNVTILYTRKKGDLILFKDIPNAKQDWLAAAPYIDCGDEVLKAKAIDLTKDYQGNLDKAKQIHQFISSYLQLNIYRDAFQDNASRTYALGYGDCMNFSRLYIALCRAVNIPARSVWGVIYGYRNDNIYDYHHQWVEVLDENGYWHPADFKYNKKFDLNDIRYLDLLYAAEENTVVKNRSPEEIMLGDVKYFNNYPAPLTGRLGFELVEDKRPESMTVKFVYKF